MLEIMVFFYLSVQMGRKLILFFAFCAFLFVGASCANRTYQYKPTASYKPWRYYNNYSPFNRWHRPRHGGHRGYYYKPRHRFQHKVYRSRNKGWYQNSGYSR